MLVVVVSRHNADTGTIISTCVCLYNVNPQHTNTINIIRKQLHLIGHSVPVLGAVLLSKAPPCGRSRSLDTKARHCG